MAFASIYLFLFMKNNPLVKNHPVFKGKFRSSNMIIAVKAFSFSQASIQPKNQRGARLDFVTERRD